jgi:hypothetical protein
MTARALVLCLALTAVPAGADQLVAQSLPVDGAVPTRCKLSQPTAIAVSNSTFNSGDAGGTLVLGTIVGQDALTTGAGATFRFAITCTGAHALVITSNGGLINQATTAAATGFSTRADYSLSASWGTTSRSLTTDGNRASLDLSQAAARTGNLDIVFNLPLGRGPMTAGSYTDQVFIQLTAQ